ncbi:MAG: hypothetical protein ACFB10_17025 [Salibacteraceae bacterium]
MNIGPLKGRFGCLLLALLVVLSVACEPEEEEIKAEVLVLDQDDRVVPNALVVLFCDGPQCVVRDSTTSNSLGIASFEFDFPAVLFVDVKVTLTEDSIVGTTAIPVDRKYIGQGVVTLEEGQTAEETVVIERDL